MNAAVCKLDKRGRLTLPLTFFHANKMIPEEYNAIVNIISGNNNSIKITFEKSNKKIE
jgi:hypothetical protein